MSDLTFNPFTSDPKKHSIEKLIQYFEIPILSKAEIKIEKNGHKIPYSYCKKHSLLPIEKQDNAFIIATSNPFQAGVESELAFMLDASIQMFYLPQEELSNLIDKYFHHEGSAASKLIQKLSDKPQSEGNLQIYDLLDQEKEGAPSIRLLNSVIKEAISQGVSDIHFEPVEETFRIRYRIDGVLQNRHKIPSHYKSNITSRLKLIAKLDIAETRRPQDGRIKLKMGNKEIDFRVSTIPISSGERIVLRILDKNNLLLGFEHMGMSTNTLDCFKTMIKRSEGIILVTGPTGSGKTTTLYSAVSEIYHESLNIMTIEDPVEYKLSGIAQMGVQPKIDLTFSKGLKHILRQDPDVILIGEIRDLETAKIAIQAALTGHLVLSTLHTNDAPSAITRLVDMGIEPYLLSSCVIGVLAQRLVRTICPHCKESHLPPNKDIETLGLQMQPNALFYHGAGCQECYNTGYRGRQGIYELMPVKGKTKIEISQSSNSQAIKKCAISDGMITLKKQGCDLIQKGTTTVEEVLRVALGMEDI
ncbi:MAG: Type II secretion system protein E [Chlamydiae bacterium]|nr:Type II secretion system protein E [Chlamydiota bacterium]